MEKLFIEEKIIELRNNIEKVTGAADDKLSKVVDEQKTNLEKFKHEIILALTNMVNEIESKAKSSNNEKAVKEYLNITGEKLNLAIEQTINRIGEFKENVKEECRECECGLEADDSHKEDACECYTHHSENQECECACHHDETSCGCHEEVCECESAALSQEDEDIINIKKIIKDMYENNNEEINHIIKEVKLATSIINKNVEEGLSLDILKNDPVKARKIVFMIFEKTLEHLKKQIEK